MTDSPQAASSQAALAAPRTEVYAEKDQLVTVVAERLLAVLVDAARHHGDAHAVLTGGSAGVAVLAQVAQLVATPGTETPPWHKVHFWWGDERLLPSDDPERNAVQAHEALLEVLIEKHGLPEGNIHPMATSEDAAEPFIGAEMYASELQGHSAEGGRSGLALPRFDVLLLGVGPDGHVASLFPGKASLHVTEQVTTSEDESPKPPLQRITLTFPAIHTAERVWMVVAGADKAEAAAKALTPGTEVTEIPAVNARGARETIWHLDQAAASTLR
ncbi:MULTISPECIES: 6-phosphogluconolactonase [unclassified Nesterenkonia]|uniref:6-phosphogluconolactonase n=1 Tax=unclassified Nesterenkonia TaxID=2629769 RepID=UPI001F4CAFD7|nr:MULTISPECIES: 6-phosphogluconolactonase [unclassified Nesterenkonia]MCH8559380.1 6-phosphogluconolactonase [Nesterenkonia sp. DZ6]MCH8571880.1 6-phosphogluconolactonase [Nesterenkonia sp. AY15]